MGDTTGIASSLMTNELEDLMQQPGMSTVITMPSSFRKSIKFKVGQSGIFNYDEPGIELLSYTACSFFHLDNRLLRCMGYFGQTSEIGIQPLFRNFFTLMLVFVVNLLSISCLVSH